MMPLSCYGGPQVHVWGVQDIYCPSVRCSRTLAPRRLRHAVPLVSLAAFTAAGCATAPAAATASRRQFTAGRRTRHYTCHAAAADEGSGDGVSGSGGASSGGAKKWEDADCNQLQTELKLAVQAEDYARAGAIRDELAARRDASGEAPVAGWADTLLPTWLIQRAEQYGFLFPTEVQARAVDVLLRQQRDCVIQAETGSGKTLAFLLPAMVLPTRALTRVGPTSVILVPTKELGVQTAMLAYKLWGGSVNPGIPGLGGNMYAYSGPRNMKVRGLLDKEEVLLAKTGDLLETADLLVATPEALAEALADPNPKLEALQHTRLLVIDEVDACFQAQSEAMEAVLTAVSGLPSPPRVAAAGATVQDGFTAVAQQMGWMTNPALVAVGQGGVPRGLRHAMIVCDPARAVLALCRHIRADLKARGDDAPPARILVFTPSQEAAEEVAEPLRNALWGLHKLAVLLPDGQEPIRAMHAFRDNAANLLIATPPAARGLDLPEVALVVNLGAPVDSVDYLHRAGRAGRVGSTTPATVLSVVSEEQREQMQELAQQLSIQIEELPEPPPEDATDSDATRRGLDDIYNLF
mmetsp:Transcript_16428/g.49215  ORF Transcript_16428/g.49215 Transcript_16428/m.49215 type:complete len:579 (+) Transcript_16428:69-1805(+)